MGDHLLAIERAIAIEQRELRRFIDDLKPPARRAGEQGALARALDELRDRLGGEWQAPITVRVAPPDLALRAEVEDGVRLMVREAAVNAFKHAHPKKVDVRLECSGPELLVAVEDDGKGFDERAQSRQERRGLGLLGMRERAQLLGGTIEISATRGKGTTVTILMPILPEQRRPSSRRPRRRRGVSYGSRSSDR